MDLIKRANSLNVIRLLNKPVEFKVIEDIIEDFRINKNMKQDEQQKTTNIKQKNSFIKTIIKKLKGKED